MEESYARVAEDIDVRIISRSVGDVTRTDVAEAANVHSTGAAPATSAAAASPIGSSRHAMVLGFNVSLADGSARARAKEMDIPITRDSVIYRIEDQLRKKLSELLPMERGVTEIGTARVLKVFKLHDRSGSTVAGLSVSSGTVQTGETVGFKVRRNGKDLPGAEFLRARDATLRIHKEQVRQDCQVLLCIIA